jgi:phage terminase large subunit-like protein
LDDAKGMISQSKHLSRRTNHFKELIICETMKSRLAILPHDPGKLDGLDQHMGLVDEVHAHKTREQWDVMLGGSAARRQPMQIGITTAGSDKGPTSICWELHEYSRNILEQVFVNDNWFTFIAAADASDDPQAEETWRKANPNYDVSVTPAFMKQMALQSNTAASLANFKRKHLNMWVGRNLKALDVEIWKKNTDFNEDAWTDPDFQTFTAVDLGFVDDLAAVATVRAKIVPFERLDDGESVQNSAKECESVQTADEEDTTPANRIEIAYCRLRLFCPEHGPRDLNAEPWMTWIENGWLEVTPGNVTDMGWVYNAVADSDAAWNVESVAIDPWNARQMATELVEYGTTHGKPEGWVNLFKQQSWAYNEPVQEFLSMIVSGRLQHDGNPMLTWMIDNLMLVTDSSGRVKPDKGKSSEKVDGAVALIMAIARAMFCDLEPPVYESRGLRTL